MTGSLSRQALPQHKRAADLVEEEARNAGFSYFGVEPSGAALYVTSRDKNWLYLGEPFLEGLTEVYERNPKLARTVTHELVKHEKLGHLGGGRLSAEELEKTLESHKIFPFQPEGYLILERQANLNAICLDEEADNVDRLAGSLGVKLWNRAVHVPTSHIEGLIKAGRHKRIETDKSYTGNLLRRPNIEEEVRTLSYTAPASDNNMRRAATLVREYVKGYLDEVYPYLSSEFGEKVVREVHKID